MSQQNLAKIEEQYHRLVARGEYSPALNLADENAHLFPPHAQGVVYYWRFRLAALLGEKDRALQLMEEALAAGNWYVGLEDDADFALLHDEPAFNQIATVSKQRRSAAMANAQLVLKALEPANGSPPYPLLLAFHGNSDNISLFEPHWRTAVAEGWLVGLPQSSQSYGPDNYSWSDWEWSLQEGRQAYRQLIAEYPVAHHRIILSGFSMGAGLAAFLGLDGEIDINGLILVSPFVSQVENLRPLLTRQRHSNLRVFLVASDQDKYCREVAEQMAELFLQYNIPCKLKVYPDLGHRFPPPFEQELADALKFVCPS